MKKILILALASFFASASFASDIVAEGQSKEQVLQAVDSLNYTLQNLGDDRAWCGTIADGYGIFPVFIEDLRKFVGDDPEKVSKLDDLDKQISELGDPFMVFKENHEEANITFQNLKEQITPILDQLLQADPENTELNRLKDRLKEGENLVFGADTHVFFYNLNSLLNSSNSMKAILNEASEEYKNLQQLYELAKTEYDRYNDYVLNMSAKPHDNFVLNDEVKATADRLKASLEDISKKLSNSVADM